MSPNVEPGFLAPFPAWSLTLPPPLPFERDLYAAALDEHARLLARHAERLIALTREAATSQRPHVAVVDLVGIVVAGPDGDPDEVYVEQRGDAAFQVRAYRAVLARLLLRPEHPHMFLVVAARGVVSLHTARVDRIPGASRSDDRRLLVVTPGEIAFEPLALKHFTSSPPWTITRWKHPDGERRWAWVSAPPEPASDDEAIDRILARFEERVRRALWAFLKEHGAKSEPIVLVMSTPHDGDGFAVEDRADAAAFAQVHPALVRAIREHATPSRVPVWVFMGLKSGLRWFELRADQRADEPLQLVDACRTQLYAVEPPAASDEEAAEPPPEPRRKPSSSEVLDMIMESGTEAEIALRLLPMTSAELDQEIGKVGFDPNAERTTIWLRESVIDASQKRSFEDEKGRNGLASG